MGFGKETNSNIITRGEAAGDVGDKINITSSNALEDAANSMTGKIKSAAESVLDAFPSVNESKARLAYGIGVQDINLIGTNLCYRAKINAIWVAGMAQRAQGWIKKGKSPMDAEPDGIVDLVGNFLGFGEESTHIREGKKLLKYSKSIRPKTSYTEAFDWAWHNKNQAAVAAYAICFGLEKGKKKSEDLKPTQVTAVIDPQTLIMPYDRRMDRLYLNSTGDLESRIPFDTHKQHAGTIGYTMGSDTILEKAVELDISAEDAFTNAENQKQIMRKDDFYIGIPSLINTYSITKLYGSKGGEYLLDQKGKRAWYEVDQTQNDKLGFSKNPTTSSIINWGNQDPYGRTPYHFTDFAFCKYWNLIPNNRLITLRRFAAPIYDNMKFPGMDGLKDDGTPADSGANDPKTLGKDGKIQKEGTTTKEGAQTLADGGTGKKVDFPPMATVITYFGDETNNKISELLKFQTGFEWDEAEANLHEVTPNENPDSEAGPGGKLLGGVTKYVNMFNIGLGNFDNKAILNQGVMPPDPYKDGPYENRIIGPVNRITKVKKRKAGLKFGNTLPLTFEYVARPIGGVNPKAALLDILSNFLVVGSASAVFWGGQHRFMGQPQKYPFIGGDKGIQQWYRGDPVGWGSSSMESLGKEAPNIMSMGANFFKEILGAFTGGSVGEITKNIGKVAGGKGAIGNAVKAYAAEKSSGQIPYLTGMKALLIGEPVGEWHVTMGNPLNPIAMIGNLICESIEFEFNDELGPDDFPTELKVTVQLEHGMARDRDAIQSIFNRGMGRIYELPDNMSGSADFETGVDKYTKNLRDYKAKSGKYAKTGRNPDWFNVPIGDSRTNYGKYGKAAQRPASNGGGVSVWKRPAFESIEGTSNQNLSLGNIDHKSQFRAADWVFLKALK